MILYETLTGVTPYQEDCKDTFYVKVIYGNERPSFERDEFGHAITCIETSSLVNLNDGTDKNPGYYLMQLKNFIQSCWDPLYTNRPTAKQAVELFTMLENVMTHGTAMECSSNVCEESLSMTNETAASRTSMLASQGDYSWTKESVGVSSPAKDQSLGATITSVSSMNIPVNIQYQQQQACHQSTECNNNVCTNNLKTTISSLYSNGSMTDVSTPVSGFSPNTAFSSKDENIRQDEKNFLQRGYQTFVKHLVRY